MAATPVYRATAATFVSVNGGRSTVDAALQGSLFAQERVKSYGYVATSDSVMSGVIEDLGLAMTPGQLAQEIDVNTPDDTVILEISATNPNPALAGLLLGVGVVLVSSRRKVDEEPVVVSEA